MSEKVANKNNNKTNGFSIPKSGYASEIRAQRSRKTALPLSEEMAAHISDQHRYGDVAAIEALSTQLAKKHKKPSLKKHRNTIRIAIETKVATPDMSFLLVAYYGKPQTVAA